MLLTHIHVFSPFTRFTYALHASPVRASSAPTRRRLVKTAAPQEPKNLRHLTSRIVQLTRRKQLRQVNRKLNHPTKKNADFLNDICFLVQILDEVEVAKKHFGKLNSIVMNAVVEACVRCGDIDSAIRIFDGMKKRDGCGVDTVTYATLLKVLYYTINVHTFRISFFIFKFCIALFFLLECCYF